MLVEEPTGVELQADTVQKEKIVLAIYAGEAGFSAACLLSLLTLTSLAWPGVLSACLFSVSIVTLAHVILSKYHALHKTRDFHIGHVIISDKYAEKPRTVATLSAVLGFLLLCWQISLWCFLVCLLATVVTVRHFLRFKKELNQLPGLQELAASKKRA